jgi:zinc transport system substrate-binding protein
MFGKNIKFRWVALLTATLATFWTSCLGEKRAPQKPIIVVSIVPESYFVKKVAGDLVDVKVMIPSGANHEMYEPTMNQIIYLSKASLYIKVGHPNFTFERAWLEKLLSQQPNIKVVNGSAGCELLSEDPHVWLSLKCARSMARNIARALVEKIPSKKDVFESNLDKFQNEIDLLDLELKKMFSKITRRRFYVFHPAWAYFAEDLGLEQIALEHGHKEPDTHRVQDTISKARADGARVVFAQPEMSKKSAELAAGEIGGRVVTIDPLAEDWMEGMKKSAHAIREALLQ